MEQPSEPGEPPQTVDLAVPAPVVAKRPRVSADERRRLILEAATDAFAEGGFSVGTRTLARRLGVTQALLYRYFPSKEALVAGVVEGLARGRADAAPYPLLVRPGRPLTERLTDFYQRYLDDMPATAFRLFLRAALEAGHAASPAVTGLSEQVLPPLVGALRAELGLPALDARPMRLGERELALGVHGAMLVLNIRRHVYAMPMPSDMSGLVELQVRAFLPGTLIELARLHGLDPARDAAPR